MTPAELTTTKADMVLAIDAMEQSIRGTLAILAECRGSERTLHQDADLTPVAECLRAAAVDVNHLSENLLEAAMLLSLSDDPQAAPTTGVLQ